MNENILKILYGLYMVMSRHIFLVCGNNHISLSGLFLCNSEQVKLYCSKNNPLTLKQNIIKCSLASSTSNTQKIPSACKARFLMIGALSPSI